MTLRLATLMTGLMLHTGLAGCAGLSSLAEATAPTDLYTLSPKSTFSASLPKLQSQIVVNQPTATALVDTNQIAVQPTSLQVQYLPDARWIDRAPLIVQALLIESFENTGKVPAVGSSAIGLRADYLVVTDIREFQAFVPEQSEGSALHIDVRLNIKLVDAFSDRIIASRSFEEIVVSASDEAADVASAFDEALGDTMRDAIEWSIREIAKSAADQDRQI
ncbi:ABC-type transport auxiliary lipoprotein family protein [Aestuariivita sp.]|jgi:cholesterol transport system auxiliary component|uniref:ABC-type transport auxiliary lipoprotein family protein n=1 Tax=Aestuariivita sp. TaxID=1872407 RepID=UPI0025C3917F|nr:ABC-type transport auxiliary lipoprotein family protein [Aestuariivita sp.]